MAQQANIDNGKNGMDTTFALVDEQLDLLTTGWLRNHQPGMDLCHPQINHIVKYINDKEEFMMDEEELKNDKDAHWWQYTHHSSSNPEIS